MAKNKKKGFRAGFFKLVNNRPAIPEMVFWVGYIMSIAPVFFSNVSFLKPAIVVINYLSIFVLAGYMLYENLRILPIKKNVPHYLIMLALFIAFIATGNYTIVKFLAVAYCFPVLSFKKFVKKDFYIRIVMFAILLLFLAFGMCDVVSRVRGDVVRYTLGFLHPNTAGFVVMTLALEYVYIFRKNHILTHIFAVIAAAIICNFIMDSRSCVICLLFFIVPFLILRRFPLTSKRKNYVLYSLPIIFTLISLVFVEMFKLKVPLMVEINSIFSDRLAYSLEAIHDIGVGIFGGATINGPFILDNAYVYYLLDYGVVLYCVFLFIVCRGIKYRHYEEKDNLFILVFITMLLYGLMEKTSFMPTYNVFMIGLAPALFWGGASKRIKELSLLDINNKKGM